MERVGGFAGKADQLNGYYTDTGDPDWFNEDLARYRAIGPTDIQAAAYLQSMSRRKNSARLRGGASGSGGLLASGRLLRGPLAPTLG